MEYCKSKTNQINILELLYSYVKHSKKPLRVSVVSEQYKELQEFWESILSKDNCTEYINDNSEYTFNNSHVEFFNVDNKTKLYTPNRDILFLINIDTEYYRELMIRTTGAIIRL